MPSSGSINNATTWEITIDKFDVDIAAGLYYYDLQTTDSGSDNATWLKGTWRIVKGITS